MKSGPKFENFLFFFYIYLANSNVAMVILTKKRDEKTSLVKNAKMHVRFHVTKHVKLWLLLSLN